MNMLLLFKEDFIENTKSARITDKRIRHIKKVLKKNTGDNLAVGLEGGKIGTGTISLISSNEIIIETSLTKNPPSVLPVTLLLALPRPKVLRRIIQTATSMGVKKIIILNSYRVEKSYWDSPKLNFERLSEYVKEGLEQAKDTILPEIKLKKYFKPFVEDELPDLCRETTNLIAHPYTNEKCPNKVTGRVTLAIGPEGGFIPYEVQKLIASGFSPVSLGERILKVETAVPVLLSRIH